MRKTITAAIAIIIAAVALTACTGVETITGKDTPDVKASTPSGPKTAEKPATKPKTAKPAAVITSCEKGDFGYPQAKVAVRNAGSGTRTFNVQVVFNGRDGSRLADGYALVNSLEAGQKSQEEVMGLKQVSGDFSCKINKIDSWAS